MNKTHAVITADLTLPCGCTCAIRGAGPDHNDTLTEIGQRILRVEALHRCHHVTAGNPCGLQPPTERAAEAQEQATAKVETTGRSPVAVGDRVVLLTDWPDFSRTPPGPRRGAKGTVQAVEHGWAKVRFDGDPRDFFATAEYGKRLAPAPDFNPAG
ncbi:MAG: hypothetical protein AB7V08_13960 [Elusimicrobiales bacterium]